MSVACTLNSHCGHGSYCDNFECQRTPKVKVKTKGGKYRFRSSGVQKSCDKDETCKRKGFRCVTGRCIKVESKGEILIRDKLSYCLLPS